MSASAPDTTDTSSQVSSAPAADGERAEFNSVPGIGAPPESGFARGPMPTTPPPVPMPPGRSETVSPAAAAPAVGAGPLAKRPKGRWFMFTILVTIISFVGYMIWDSFLRYQAYGTVSGRVVQVSSRWGGTITSLRVREGDHVKQGQVLAAMDNRDLDDRLRELDNDVRLARATLDAEMAQFRWQTQIRGNLIQQGRAEYYEKWGELLQEQALRDELQSELDRLQSLQKEHSASVSSSELESARFRLVGQTAKVEKLTEAVEQMKTRVDVTKMSDDAVGARVKPHLVRIESLQTQVAHLRRRVLQRSIKSPVDGRVIRIHRLSGEHSGPAEPIVEILQDGTQELIIYVPQSGTDLLSIGDVTPVQVAPFASPLDCQVHRIGDRLELPPANLKRYYRSHQTLLPVYLQPVDLPKGASELRLGAEIKLPIRWSRKLGKQK